MKKRLMCLLLALLMLALPLSGCGSDGGRIAADSRSGVVRILALLPDLTTGEVYYATGSAFGVGKAASPRASSSPTRRAGPHYTEQRHCGRPR
ncbi:MAG: hypothetical protein ACLUEK_00070 [Oscillospiraceae bacterium]